MLLLDFLNNNKNWEEILTSFPYNIKVKRNGKYILLAYSQFDSDLSNPLVQEARGCIFKEVEPNKYICVCWPFNKFFNYGQAEAANVDCNSSVVYEKIDGSLIKLFYDNGWHIATNGCIDAADAEYDDMGHNFADLFWSVIADNKNKLFKFLDTNKTYMFELVSPQTRLVVLYPEASVYYLGERETQTGKEDFCYLPTYEEFNIKCPKIYFLNSLEQVQEFANTLSDDAEGFVVCDKNFNRVKVKGIAYLSMFWRRCNDNLGVKSIVQMIKNETIDDVIAYNEHIMKKYQEIVQIIMEIVEIMEREYEDALKQNLSKRDVATTHKDCFEYPYYIVTKMSYPEITPSDYLFDRMTNASLVRLIKEKQNGN